MPRTKNVIIVVLTLLSSLTVLVYWKVSNIDTKKKNDGTNSLNNSDKLFLQDGLELKLEYHQRSERVQKFCKEYHLGKYAYKNRTNDLHVKDPPTPQYSYFYINKEQNLAWCPVYKAGSTSWLHNMMILAGFSEQTISNPPKQLSMWARDVYGEGEPGPVFDNAVKLLIVRHPFTRLVSAYRDKLSNASQGLEHGTAHFYEKYGRTIIDKFRDKNSNLKQIEPTFPEFVNYIINTDFVYYDDHWLPVYYSCTPCRVNYDYIAKVETFYRDQNFIIKGEHLEDRLKPKWKHKMSKQKNSFDEALPYFSSLSKIQVQALYKIYRLDFQLFGYSIDKHLAYAKD